MKTHGIDLKRIQFSRLFKLAAAFMLATSAIHAGWFGPAGNDSAEKRATVRKQSEEMLSELYQTKPELKETIRKAAGYATFKCTDMHLLMLASANGYGLLVNNQNEKATYMRVASLGGGVGVGVKDVRVIFIFHDEKIMKQFVEQGWQFGGRADAAAKYEDTGISAEENVKASVDFKDGTISSGSSTDVRAGAQATTGKTSGVSTKGGMEIYQFTDKGLALQATVAGTKYWKDSKLN
jgi:lipid-binding SYLF domain-containing protein